MGVKTRSRMLAVLVAVVMVFTSAIGVFAGTASSTQGTSQANNTSVNVAKGTIKVKTTDKTVKYKVGNGSWKTSKSTTIKGLKNGNKVIIKTSKGNTYRWVKKVTFKSNKNGKISWKKVSGATGYLLKITKNGKSTWKKVTGTSYKAGKGATVRVRPLTKKGGKVYSGKLSAAKKVK